MFKGAQCSYAYENEILGIETTGCGVRPRVKFQDYVLPSAIFKIDNQQGPTVYHRGLFSILCNNLNRKRI